MRARAGILRCVDGSIEACAQRAALSFFTTPRRGHRHAAGSPRAGAHFLRHIRCLHSSGKRGYILLYRLAHTVSCCMIGMSKRHFMAP